SGLGAPREERLPPESVPPFSVTGVRNHRLVCRFGPAFWQGDALVPVRGLVLAVAAGSLQGLGEMLSENGVIRVGVDARCLNRPPLRGMGRYLCEAIARISAREPVRWQLFADRPDLPLHLPPVENLDARVFEFRGYRFRLWEQMALPWSARRTGVDLLHCPAS